MIDTSLTKFPDIASNSKPKIVDAGYDNSKMSNSDFLKVLLADLQWQDPLNAKDISEFINNTVKLREMESLENIQKLSESISKLTNGILSAAALIGKKVKYEGNETYIQNGKAQVDFKLDSQASLVKISVVDQKGNTVDEKIFENLNANTVYPLQIDNPSIGDGYYKVVIAAKDTQGKDISSTIYSYGIVNGVYKNTDGSIYAKISDKSVALDKILEISM